MKAETLLAAVMEMAAPTQSNVEDITAAVLPEFSGNVNLGKPQTYQKEARKVLQQRVDDGVAEMQAELDSLDQQIKDEEQVLAEANVDAAQAIKDGTETRESLAIKRANATVSSELIMDLDKQRDVLKDKFDRERRRLLNQGSRLMGWVRTIQTATAAYQIDFVQGVDRLNREKYARQLNQLLAFRAEAKNLLGDELAQALEEEITTRPVPPTLIECLWEGLPEKDREKYAEHEPIPTIIETATGDAA